MNNELSIILTVNIKDIFPTLPEKPLSRPKWYKLYTILNDNNYVIFFLFFFTERDEEYDLKKWYQVITL